MRPVSIALLSAALASCVHDHHDHNDSGPGIPVFVEQERNDDPLTANHFGVIRPGDRFFIDGFVRDDLADPFDGFAFTAGQPVHVDFQLFIGNAFADLDVCLYDPQIDEVVACFATTDDPERGGVDVFDGGLDFHLVIESFAGDSTYSLEIAVQPLFALEALGEGAARGLSGSGGRAERPTDATEGYRKPAPAPRIVMEQVIECDAESGLLLVRMRREDELGVR